MRSRDITKSQGKILQPDLPATVRSFFVCHANAVAQASNLPADRGSVPRYHGTGVQAQYHENAVGIRLAGIRDCLCQQSNKTAARFARKNKPVAPTFPSANCLRRQRGKIILHACREAAIGAGRNSPASQISPEDAVAPAASFGEAIKSKTKNSQGRKAAAASQRAPLVSPRFDRGLILRSCGGFRPACHGQAVADQI